MKIKIASRNKPIETLWDVELPTVLAKDNAMEESDPEAGFFTSPSYNYEKTFLLDSHLVLIYKLRLITIDTNTGTILQDIRL